MSPGTPIPGLALLFIDYARYCEPSAFRKWVTGGNCVGKSSPCCLIHVMNLERARQRAHCAIVGLKLAAYPTPRGFHFGALLRAFSEFAHSNEASFDFFFRNFEGHGSILPEYGSDRQSGHAKQRQSKADAD